MSRFRVIQGLARSLVESLRQGLDPFFIRKSVGNYENAHVRTCMPTCQLRGNKSTELPGNRPTRDGARAGE